MDDIITRIKENRSKQDVLLEQLDRQLAFKERTGIDAHEIASMTLHPLPRKSERPKPIEYETTVVLKNGESVRLSFDVVKALGLPPNLR